MENICSIESRPLSEANCIQMNMILKTLLFAALIFLALPSFSQVPDTIPPPVRDSITAAGIYQNDTIPPDTIKEEVQQQKSFMLEDVIVYTSYDSSKIDFTKGKAYLFGNYNMSKISYQDIVLEAGYIEIDFNRKELYARGFTDSTGKVIHAPIFQEGDKKYESEELRYNFDTKKGLITGVFTEEGQGYLHGHKVKKSEDNSAWIQKGKYTTCNLKHPHYQVQFQKARVIPSDKIVTGPANLIIEDVPTPVWIPFGIFPNKKDRANGLLPPSVGESGNRGFFLKGLGYYWGLGEHMDLALRGDIYSRGSWAVNLASNYVVRYKYSGSLGLDYSYNRFNDKGDPNFSEEKEFFIRWNHQQSPKARPNSSFSASVNAGSSESNKFNPSSTQEYLRNDFTSSINYSTVINGKYSFSSSFRHNQNTLNNQVKLTLPQISFSVQRFYPLRRKEKVGELKWYENITMSYNLNAENSITTYDSIFFQSRFKDFNNGMQHTIPISSNLKVLNHFNFNNTITLNGYWYLNSIRQRWNNDISVINGDTVMGYVETDTLIGFTQGYEYRYSSTLHTKLYGMIQMKKGLLRAVRHVLTPSISFNYRPDFSNQKFGYYYHYLDGNSRRPVQYSIFSEGIYGGPPSGTQGSVNFSLSNNLEAKIRDRQDTVSGTRKVVLIKTMNATMGYNLAADSLNWSTLNVNANTRLFDEIDVRFNGSWDPYALNDKGQTIDVLEWDKNGRLFRRKNNMWHFDVSYRISSETLAQNKTTKTKVKEVKPDLEQSEDIPPMENQNPATGQSADFTNKWDLGFHYTLTHNIDYINNKQTTEYETIQSLGFDANIQLTEKWKIGMKSGWDFERNQLTYTSVNIYRDLHCWEMMFNWIPFGFRKSYNLTIRVKAPALQDMKLTKRKSHLDYYNP